MQVGFSVGKKALLPPPPSSFHLLKALFLHRHPCLRGMAFLLPRFVVMWMFLFSLNVRDARILSHRLESKLTFTLSHPHHSSTMHISTSICVAVVAFMMLCVHVSNHTFTVYLQVTINLTIFRLNVPFAPVNVSSQYPSMKAAHLPHHVSSQSMMAALLPHHVRKLTKERLQSSKNNLTTALKL